ncbi:MAG TPA: ATP-binding protein [Candidatus Kapabacteria bacterium]|nr:ATP-binding protein [Candidatus Kapabacteria bacterium]
MNPRILYNDHLRIPATLEELQHVYGWAEEHLSALDIEDSKRYDIMLALSEAVTNAIRHGSSELVNATVDIQVEVTTESVMLKVSDRGSGFNPDHLPDPTTGHNVFIPNGRGVYLIRTLADEVTFDFSDSGTTVEVHFRR